MHFAQINLMDGFFIAGRDPDPGFTWDKLVGKKVLVDHGGQPLAMFKYAAHRMGIDYGGIEALDVGGSDAIEAAFRARRADYVHLQGPAPQQLEKDGVGHIVASVGEAIGPVAFSSLAATRDWLETDMAHAFMRAYRKARAFVIETPAAEASAPVRARVTAARDIQATRHRRLQENGDGAGAESNAPGGGLGPDNGAGVAATNAALPARMLHQACGLSKKQRRRARQEAERLGISARGWHRVLRVARTIADLRGSEAVGARDLSEAFQYRRQGIELEEAAQFTLH